MVSRLTVKGQVTIPKPLRESLGLEGQELEFEERTDALIVRRRAPVDPLRQLVGVVRRRADGDAYLEETRGPRWQTDLDGRTSSVQSLRDSSKSPRMKPSLANRGSSREVTRR